jgi:lipoteichoic acid synthase
MMSKLLTRCKPYTTAIWSVITQFAIIETLIFVLLNLYKLAYLHKYFNVYGQTFSHLLIITIGAMGFMLFWIYWLSYRGKVIALVSIHVFLIALMYSDLIYYRYFSDLITIPVLMQIGQANALTESIQTLVKPEDYVIFIDLLVVIPYLVIVLWTKRTKKSDPPHPKHPFSWSRVGVKSIPSLSVLVISAFLFLVPMYQLAHYKDKNLFETNWWNLSMYRNTGLLAFHEYDLYRYIKLNWFTDRYLSTNEISDIENWLDNTASLRASSEQDSTFGAYRGKNVIIVQIEAMQNFMIGQSYQEQELTPNFNALLKNSAYFSQFYHQTAAGRTSDADFLANCSLHPVAVGAVFTRYAQNDFTCVPQVLKDNGYTANVFHAFEGGFWNRNMMYQTMGYDKFYTKEEFQDGERIGWSIGDESFFKQSVNFISKKTQPSYSFLITLSSHHPFDLPSRYQTLELNDMPDNILRDYLQSIHYVDTAIGELIQDMKDKGLWDNSILIIYGDHDNSIHNMNTYKTYLGREPTEWDKLQLQRQIPFFIHFPDEKYAGIYPEPAGQLDIAPTILHLLGISSSKLPYMGTPLITDQPIKDRLIMFRNGSFVDDKHYYVSQATTDLTLGSCYDRKSGAKVDVAACIPHAEATLTQFKYSDQILDYNLIPTLLKDN